LYIIYYSDVKFSSFPFVKLKCYINPSTVRDGVLLVFLLFISIGIKNTIINNIIN